MLDDDQAVTADTAAAIAHVWLVTPPPQVLHQRAGRRIGVERRERMPVDTSRC
ncbi:hypothetical protein [Streptomyces sp. NPDC001820]|uniref:hypothetical protein n=1 Tax=Streptomyces sp. NPDC001820 TaxID=3364613 RepID=UPI0036D061E9